MTVAQGYDLIRSHLCETGQHPARWFISAQAWHKFCDEQYHSVLTMKYTELPGRIVQRQFLGLPVVLVIDDGIFECH